jgi:hypothetical protein
LAIDPNDETTMYASVVHSTAGGIFRTDNLEAGAASVWTNTTAPPRTEGHPYNVFVLEDGTLVSTWCGRRAPGFTTSSGVFTSADQGTTWTDVSMNDDMYYWTKDITIDPTDATQNTWYVSVFSGWGGAANDKGGLYKTTDRGLTWSLFVDLYRVESSTVNPQNADEIYISTENEGLWYTNNATATTPTFVQLDEYVFQHPMRIFYDPFDNENVWVTSFGNGIKMGSTAPNTNSVAQTETARFVIYPNPSTGIITLTSEAEIGVVKVYDLSNRILFSTAPIDQTKAEINLEHLPAGIYFIQVSDSSGAHSTTRLVID